MADDLKDAIKQNAEGPKQAGADGVNVQQHAALPARPCVALSDGSHWRATRRKPSVTSCGGSRCVIRQGLQFSTTFPG